MTALPTISLMRAAEESDAFPILDRAGDRLVRGLKELFAGLGVPGVSIARDATKLISFDGWRDERSQSLFVRYRLLPLKRPVVLALPASLFTAMVDLYFGGAGLPRSLGEELTAAEARFADRFAGQFAACLGLAWAETGVARPDMEKRAMKSEEAAGFSGHEPIAVQDFHLSGSALGEQTVSLLTPVSALRGLQAEPDGEADHSTSNSDPQWKAQLQQAMRDVRLPVRSVLARPEMGLSQLLALKPGDVIPLLMPQHVPLTVSGRPFAVGNMGEANGRAAIRIEKIMKGFSQ